METENIEILSDGIKEYFGNYELEELCGRFNIEIEHLGVNPNHTKLVTELMADTSRENHRRFLEDILSKLLRRCEDRILNTTWEVNVFDEHMLPQLKKLQSIVAGNQKSVLRSRAANRFIKEQSQLIKLLGNAKTPLTILDTQIGQATFDSIQMVKTPVRLLIGQSQQDMAVNLNGQLAQLRKQGRDIEVRHHLKLNDRFIIFNGRCWMTSCSLIEVGQVTLSMIECLDTKPVVVKEIGRKWREAKVFLG
jgi:REP element-mobilizing transposase RayT